MPDLPVSRDLDGQLLFLGTGTSHGIPVIGCGCATCTSPNPLNQRTRCSLILGLPEGDLLVDTAPDLRAQLLREEIGLVHAVLYTHEHADHLFGLDDLRVFAHYLGHDLPIYCDGKVEERIRKVFDYAFDPASREYPAGGVPRLAFRPVTGEPLELLGARVIPVPLRHGRYHVWGYRFGDVAYCTDTNQIPPESQPLLEGLDVLILDCLRRRPHATHFSLDEAVAAAQRLAPKRTLFTHMCHDLEHEATNAVLPPGMELAYDGMRIPLRLSRCGSRAGGDPPGRWPK
jgi:phosphoribosyl 1,2-cyclic phosphate phosphodiesterase